MQSKAARPDISVILCTRNRAALLPEALAGLAAEIAAAPCLLIELILIDNASTDATSQILADFADQHTQLCVHILSEDRPGLAYARNAGLRQASGNILMFCDDDARLMPNYFVVLGEIFAADTLPVMRGGRVLLGDPRDLPYTIKTDTVPSVYGGRYPGGFIHGCNMAFHRKIYEAIGPLDDRFSNKAMFPSADESDYIHRAHRAGFRVEFCPALVVHHFHGRRDPAEIHRQFESYMIGDGALFAKHWRNGLLRCLLGNVFNAVRTTLWPGRLFDSTMGYSYREAAWGNLRGVWLYWRKGRGI